MVLEIKRQTINQIPSLWVAYNNDVTTVKFDTSYKLHVGNQSILLSVFGIEKLHCMQSSRVSIYDVLLLFLL